MITYPLADLHFSWQDRFCGIFGAGCGHADPSSQAGNDDTEGAGGVQASDAPASVLAERFGTTGQTVYKWKHRDSVHDRSHRPHRLQTTLTPAQEAVAVVLRKTLLVLIDDLLAGKRWGGRPL